MLGFPYYIFLNENVRKQFLRTRLYFHRGRILHNSFIRARDEIRAMNSVNSLLN